MNQVVTPKFGVGAPVRRKEDVAFVSGKGHYTDDLKVAGAAHAVVLRSSLAFAKFTLGGLDDARAMDGVQLVLTAADIKETNNIPCQMVLTQLDGSRHWVLAMRFCARILLALLAMRLPLLLPIRWNKRELLLRRSKSTTRILRL